MVLSLIVLKCFNSSRVLRVSKVSGVSRIFKVFEGCKDRVFKGFRSLYDFHGFEYFTSVGPQDLDRYSRHLK